jgi:hypothetical protein
MKSDFDRLGTGEWARLVPSEDSPRWVPKDALCQVESSHDDADKCSVVLFSDKGSAQIRVSEVEQAALRRVTPPPWHDR